MSRLTQVNRAGAILLTLDSSTSGAVIPIYSVGTSSDAIALKTDPNYQGMIGLLNNLRAIATITSIAEVDLPQFENIDSDTDRMIKALDVQWKSPRKQLAIMQSIDGGSTWVKTGAVSLLNSGGYPYTTHNLLNFLTEDVAREFADGHQVGLRLEDVGTGLLGAGDQIIIDGGFVEEFTMLEPLSSIGQVVTNDLTSIETDIQTVKNAIAAVASEVGIIKADLADDPEMSDIAVLDAKLDQILAIAGDSAGGAVRSENSTESAVTVGTSASVVLAADTSNLRISIVAKNRSTTATVYLRFGAEDPTAALHSWELKPGDWQEFGTGEAVRAIATAANTELLITEFLK